MTSHVHESHDMAGRHAIKTNMASKTVNKENSHELTLLSLKWAMC